MAKVFFIDPMVPFLEVNSATTDPMDEEHYDVQMERSSRASSVMGNPMVKWK